MAAGRAFSSARLCPTFAAAAAVALVYAGLAENDSAFWWLNKVFEDRSNWLVWLHLDPRWDGLRRDPRFAELVSRLRFLQNRIGL